MGESLTGHISTHARPMWQQKTCQVAKSVIIVWKSHLARSSVIHIDLLAGD
jgi:hypothetical protein